MEPKELWNLAVLVLVWYVANLGFNVGMKRSHALVPDVLVLTAFQFGAGAIAFGGAWLTGHAELPHARWAAPLGCSAVLLLGGTLFTNTSLTLLSVSFTHVIKTCEPFFTVVIVYFWDGKLPDATAALALLVTVVGVLLASTDQRAQSGKSNGLVVGVGVAMLANLCLQLRNVLNKKLMVPSDRAAGLGGAADTAEGANLTEGKAGAGGAGGAAVPSPPSPLELLLATMSAGLPMHLALQGCMDSYAALQPHPPAVSRYAHYGDAPVLWLLVPPLCFVVYQAASICVLARVEPVTHAVLNALKRMVVIGLGAALTHEAHSAYYLGGAALAVVGVSAYSLSKFLRSSASHTRMRIGLVAASLLLLAAFANRPISAPISGPSSGATPAAAPVQREAPTAPTAAPRQATAPAATGRNPDHGPDDTSPKMKRPPHGSAHARSAHSPQKLGAKQRGNSTAQAKFMRRRLAPAPPGTTGTRSWSDMHGAND